MYLIPFHYLFPEIAEHETRTLTITNGYMDVPNDSYGLVESYCPDPKCDCQRVMLNIFSQTEGRQVATISYGFDRSAEDAGPYLDPLNPQEHQADALLKLMIVYLAQDKAYVARLKSHYAMVKSAAADPNHPRQNTLKQWKQEADELYKTDESLKPYRKVREKMSEVEQAANELERMAKRVTPKKRHRRRK